MALTEQEILRVLMQNRDRVAAAAWIIVRDAQAAEDIFQNVVIKAITKEVVFRMPGETLSWAFITARREAIDWLRRHRKEMTAPTAEVLDLLEQDWVVNEHHEDGRAEALRACLEQLPEKSRHLLRLRYFDGHPCDVVATQLGTRINAIYKRLSRLHLALRDCVEVRMTRMGASEP